MNNKFSTTTIIGGGIVLFGILLLIRNIFNLNIPIFTIIFSITLIWIGILLIRGSIRPKTEGGQTMFGESSMNYIEGQQNYAVTFGSATVNLQSLQPDQPIHLNIECTFGEMKVLVSRDIQLRVEGNSSFGNLTGPNLQSSSFGNYFYSTPGFNESMPGITLHAKVTFGELRILHI